MISSFFSMFVKKKNNQTFFSYLNIVFLCEGSGAFIKIKIEMKKWSNKWMKTRPGKIKIGSINIKTWYVFIVRLELESPSNGLFSDIIY